MVLAFCRRGLVIPICLYLLVGRYMKPANAPRGKRNESSKTKRSGLFQSSFPTPEYTILFYFPTKSLCIL